MSELAQPAEAAAGAAAEAEAEEEEEEEEQDKVPVTVLTGFLGAGKTTLLNEILRTNTHGMRVAVIENEFGAVGVDDALVQRRISADEEIFQMNNGCICCTVRSDLIRILNKLLSPDRSRTEPLDAILIETTGMADPAPVAQTFFADPDISARARLDAIVTVADAAHLEQHLDEIKPDGAENEAVEQVVFADVVVLNKIDLVTGPQVTEVEARIRALNKSCPIVRCERARIDLGQILDVRAFSLRKALEIDPEFMALDAEHVHDDTISSVGIHRPGECDLGRLEQWLANLLTTEGQHIFRMKGVLAIQGSPDKLCFQGVHMMLSSEPLEPWEEEEPRINKLVFIGRQLGRMGLEESFARCLVQGQDEQAAKLAAAE